LSDAARTGAAAVVIATAAHRHAFEAELDAAGIDPALACREGRLIMLDASATMAAFMPDGQVDSAAFREVVGSVLRQAGAGGRAVRAYGEMVALLWDAGDVLGAIELEELWNDLGRELSFSLLCAYQSESVSGAEHAQALQQVCHLHSSVLAPRDVPAAALSARGGVSAEFAGDCDAPRSARHFVADVLARWGHAEALLEDARLVVTELATNAVLHARSPFSVTARAEGPRVRVSVRDRSPIRPTLREHDPTALSGRGLRLVAALSTAGALS
jgi:MEDS: MEthanogen/methylotroph, DcmR Sensory domain/Histidine kinase-like ATPase domain